VEFGWETKAVAAIVTLAALWLGEACIPFYTEFEGGVKRRLFHGAKNLGFGVFNAALLLLLFSSALTAVTAWTAQSDFGLSRLVAWPAWLQTLLIFILFDFWMYLWHRANHTVPFLWRFHRMHHSDPEMDASTALRFHTGEVVLSALTRLAVLPLLGMTLAQLVLYEMVFLPVILFHHSNVSLPRWVDHGLLAIVVTPAMHRVHHSRWRPETDSNYGSVFPYWDFLARSFRLRADARAIHLGLDGMDQPAWQCVLGMLRTPLASVVRSASPSQQAGGEGS
jgi:sterol desaturase/sphingolipid hydroxylase (fatty acid hydroxylase superfamily)